MLSIIMLSIIMIALLLIQRQVMRKFMYTLISRTSESTFLYMDVYGTKSIKFRVIFFSESVLK